MDGCPFCAIVMDAPSPDLVLRTATSVAFPPLEPAAQGHLLVVPQVHVRDFLTAGPELVAALAVDVSTVARATQTALAPDGMNVLTSVGEVATQTVMHLHVHVLPRWKDDRVGSFWPEQPDPALAGAATGWAAAVRAALGS